MTSLVPYASSSDDEEPPDRARTSKCVGKKRLTAFSCPDDEPHKSRSKVHTSLGISSGKPLKGDWLCHVYISMAHNEEYKELMDKAISFLKAYDSSIERVPQPHISLTKPILIRYHERPVFVSSIEDAIGNDSSSTRVTVAFSTFTCLTSEDTSRVYYTMEVGLGWQELYSLTSKLNQGLANLHARQYFKEARFHCSFASTSGQNGSKEITTRHCEALESKLGGKLRACRPIIVDEVCVATGSQISTIALK